MSIAALPAPSDPDGAFERQPPQDIGAEMSVLGGMLLSKDAAADVVELLREGDFYRPAHQLVYAAAVDLFGRGEPVDAVSVAAELAKAGSLGRVGGAPYLHTLVSSVPTAANAGYYAEIVADKAILRRLVEAGTRIVGMGYAPEGSDVDAVVDRAQAAVYEVTERRASDDFVVLEQLLNPTLEEIESIEGKGGKLSGVPTGFKDLDALTNGLHPGQMVIIAARPAMGKALSLDTALVTPTGWTTMGEVAVGDQLIDAMGRPTTVVAATEVMQGRPCYELVFSDGSTVVADAEHEWLVRARVGALAGAGGGPGGGGSTVVTTEALRAAVRAGAQAGLVPVAAPLELPRRELPLPPGALGSWLRGDGGPLAPGLLAALGRLGLLVDPHLPAAYLRASLGQRRALLTGLLGGQPPTGRGPVLVGPVSRRLARDVAELTVSLGHACTARPVGPGDGGRAGGGWVVRFLPRDKASCREVLDVRPVPSVPVRCVQVESPDHLYLAGRSMIPTHNSTLALDFCRSASVRHQLPSVFFSLEMSRSEIVMRLLSAEARVSLAHMRQGRMTEDDWTRLARRMGEVADAPLFIDDSPHLSMMEIRAKARRLKQRHGLKLVVLDYLQLMSSPRRVENRQQEVSEISRSMKLLAKELEVPVVALSQLNRNAEQRADRRPQIADLRESGSLEQDSDLVILLHREDAYEKESPRAGEADLVVAKHRNGPTDTVTVAFQGHYSRFVDMTPAS